MSLLMFLVITSLILSMCQIEIKTEVGEPTISLIELHNKLFVNDTFHASASEAPRNITDLYRGTWIFSGRGKMPFKRSQGRVTFKLQNEKSAHPEMDIVHGELVMRDGFFSTNSFFRVALQGVYLHGSGELLLMANPTNPSKSISKMRSIDLEEEEEEDDLGSEKNRRVPRVLKNFSFEVGKEAKASLLVERMSEYREKVPKENEGSNRCYYELYLKMAHFGKFANIELKKKMAENVTAFSEKRKEGDANPFVEVRAASYSPNCETVLTFEATSVYFDSFYRKALNYVVVSCVATFFQVLGLLQQMEYTKKQSVSPSRIYAAFLHPHKILPATFG